MRCIPSRGSPVVMALALVGLFTMAAWDGGSQSKEYQGWIIRQDGEERRYPQNEWSIQPKTDSFILQRANCADYVTYYGSFSVVELRREKPPAIGRMPPNASSKG